MNLFLATDSDVNNGGLERWQSIENSAEHQAREKLY